MDDNSYEFLKTLVETPSPSGFEWNAAKIWKQEAARYADSVCGDVLGNAIAVLNPCGSPRIMLAAHMDEIGFMVRYVDECGFIYFAAIGGHDDTVVVGQRVVIHNEKGSVFGVIGRVPTHLMTSEDRERKIELNKLWIDIGAENRDEALSRIAIGDPITFDTGLKRLSDKLVCSRAFDDKMGGFVLVEMLRLLHDKPIKPAVYAVATVQEEVGYRGAQVSSYAINPEIGIVLDVGHATDYPEVSKVKVGDFVLGGGPMIHRGPNVNPDIERHLVRIAKEQGIPVQMVARPHTTGTDVWAVQMAQAGVATAVISVPLRYMHTPNETLALSDLDATARLLAAFIVAMNDE